MQLKELKQHGLISKLIYAQFPLKVEYSLTAFGQTLMPVINAPSKWDDDNANQLREVIMKRLEGKALD